MDALKEDLAAARATCPAAFVRSAQHVAEWLEVNKNPYKYFPNAASSSRHETLRSKFVPPIDS
jgi:hypothetical protein